MDLEVYQKLLPTKEQWDSLVQMIESCGSRMGIIESTSWYNELTKEKQEVRDIPVFAYTNNSDRPLAVNYIIVKKVTRENTEQCFGTNMDAEHIRIMYKPDAESKVVKLYQFNQHYSHINIACSPSTFTLVYGDPEDNLTGYVMFISGQEICSPVTRYSLYDESKDIETVMLILKGQLMGQNTGSRYQSVMHVHNSIKDTAIKYLSGGVALKGAPVLSLLSCRNTAELRDPSRFKNAIRDIKQRIEDTKEIENCEAEDLIFVKYRTYDGYTLVTKKRYEETKNKLSEYYPVIQLDTLAQLLETELPKEQKDILCVGLGSAGSGILDITRRYDYFKTYVLIDPDRVETKNLRNQWYGIGHSSMSKASASKNILDTTTVNSRSEEFLVDSHSSRFQDVKEPYNNYKYKYAISGFDTIETRLEFLEYIEKGIIEANYLIDARYEKLQSALYFIDLNDEEQIKWYRKGLEEDKRILEDSKEYIQTPIEFWEWFKEKKYIHSGCHSICQQLFDVDTDADYGICAPRYNSPVSCGGDACKEYITGLFKEKKPLIEKVRVNSCVMANFIEIYKYSSSIIAAAMKEIEMGNSKPWTYIEATTDVIPTCMVLKQ